MVVSDTNGLYSFSTRSEGSKNILTIANPGAGKTEEIANFAVKLIGESVPPDKILCITFTNKASAEMRQRIEQKLSDNRNAAMAIEVTTFHSLAFTELSMYGASPNLVSENFLRYSILSSIRKRKVFNYGDAYIIDTLVPKIENAIRYVRSYSLDILALNRKKAHKILNTYLQEEPVRGFSKEEMEKFLEYMFDIISDYEEKKKELGLIDYNDLLTEYLNIPDEQFSEFEWVLVDELQDLNEAEFEIAIRSGHNHFMVGDPKQSIFGFQGGSLRNFKRFRKTFGSNVKILGKNFRSTSSILSYARAFYTERAGARESLEELKQLHSADDKSGDPVKLYLSEDPERFAAVEASRHGSEDQTVAVIARTNSQIDRIGEFLDRDNVPYSTTSPGNPDEASRSDIIKYLRAVITPGRETIIPALFTPYSEVTLEEAFHIADKYRRKKKIEQKAVEEFAPSLSSVANDRKAKESLVSLFKNKILPIAISLGKAHFLAAQAIYLSVQQYFLENLDPQLEGLFDYLSVSGVDLLTGTAGKGIILTTVHRAKGMEFNQVIYVPSRTQGGTSFIDLVSRTVVKTGKDFDPSDELEGEDDRIDFVAITRAKENLEIVCKPRFQSRYKTDPVVVEESDAGDTVDPLLVEYDRIYSMIAHGRKEEAIKAARAESSWLIDLIRDHFSQGARLSYSTISKLSSPTDFLTDYILKLFVTSPALTRGSRVHDYAEDMFRGKEIPDELGDLEPIVDNIRKVMNAVHDEFDAEQVEAEMNLQMHVSDIFPDLAERYPDTVFTGKIDAVFKGRKGNSVILDYKTDRRRVDQYVSDHRLQLYIYKLMYARKLDLDPGSINVCTGYINLQPRINTGDIDHSLDLTEPSRLKITNFKKLIARYFDYRDDPDKFVNDVLAERDSGSHLQAEIKEILNNELKLISSGSRD